MVLGLLAGCGVEGSNPPDTPLPPLPTTIVVSVPTPATSGPTTVSPAVPPTASTVLTDVYGVPVDPNLTYPRSAPPTTAPPTSPPRTDPRQERPAPPTTDCPRRKHRRRCKP
jgi:serine/threonine-protein kinase